MGVRSLIVLSFVLLSFTARAADHLPIPQKPFVGYVEAYDDDYVNAGGDKIEDSRRDPQNSMFGRVQPGINLINLAFLTPDYSTHPKKNQISGLPYSEKFMKRAVAWFHKEHPGVPVIISLGGGDSSLAAAWAHYDPKAIAKLVHDTGLDGVDIDYELEEKECHHVMHGSQLGVACSTDDKLTDIIHSMRQAMRRPAILSLTPYGHAAYIDDLSGEAAGMVINPLKRVGKDLDMINIMAYGDHTQTYDQKDEFRAFRKVFSGKITIGVSVPQDRDRPFVNLKQMSDLAAFIKNQPEAGMMLWNLQNEGWTLGPNTPEHPSADMIVQAVCEQFQTPGCPQKTVVDHCPPLNPAPPPLDQSDWFQDAVQKIPEK
jgi:hypothetical protein